MEIKNYEVEDFICDESFQHFCLGNNQEHVLFWENWIRNNPHQSEIINEAIRIVSILNARQGNLLAQSDYLKDSINRADRLKEILQDTTSGSEINEIKPVHRRLKGVKYVSAIAASLLALTLIGYLFLKPAHSVKPVISAEVEADRITSGDQIRKTVVLSDGSIIILHRNSTITLAADFSASKRELTLSGEAFFDIMHNESHPFTVHTAEIDIQVLGTEFNVKAYPGDVQTETSLFRGKVAVYKKGFPHEKTILQPNEKLVFNNGYALKQTSIPKKSFSIIPIVPDTVSNKAKEIEWVHNRLKMDDEPLETIAAKLQKWYGINIVFSDEETKNYRYSGTFESETVVQALEALQLSYPFRFKVEGEKITISK